MGIRALLVCLVAAVASAVACTPAFIGYHTSDPFASAGEGDTTVDMIGAGVCLEPQQLELCAFAGPRRVRTPYAHETGGGVQVLVIYRGQQ